MTQILRLDSSARHADSVSRDLADRLIARLTAEQGDDVAITVRDLSNGVPQLSESTLGAMWTPAADRSDGQNAELVHADAAIDELMNADAIVIGLPIYNFGPPASLKAWADLVARAGTTFRYTENGPEGLVPNKPVYVIVTSGGVPIGSPMDFSSTWITTFLGFLGLTNVTIIEAGQLNVDPEAALDAARERVAQTALVAV